MHDGCFLCTTSPSPPLASPFPRLPLSPQVGQLLAARRLFAAHTLLEAVRAQDLGEWWKEVVEED